MASYKQKASRFTYSQAIVLLGMLMMVVCVPFQTNGDSIGDLSKETTNPQILMPSPSLLPQQVVAIQLKALRDNDMDDRGIEIAFNFASPENKVFTGPLENFKQMVKNTQYEPLLNFKKCETNRMHIEGNEAQQIAIITDKNGRKAAYLFSLAKQQKGLFQGCWMVESVIRLAYEEKTVRA